ncbi:MAG: NAD-dependent epimerase/dehydratase family protein [Deltaproteobacteria bacterium]|nr:NAD-dependent epimerase/dehydratase family protein [Deltaproteobacteria bacterium]
MRVLVLGATGFLGLNTVDAVRHLGHETLAARRRRSNVIPLRSRKVALVEVELTEPETLVSAMRTADVCIHAAGHYPKLSTNAERARERGLAELEAVLDAAAQSGLRRLVYVSSTATVAPSASISNEADTFSSAPGFGVYHDLKWEMEARVAREDRLEVRVACPSACLGPWDLRVGTSALLVAVAHGLDPAHPDGWVNWVDSRDVGLGLAELAIRDRAPRRVILSAGARRLHELLTHCAARYSVPPPSPPLGPEAALSFAQAEELRAEASGKRPRLSVEIVDLVVHGTPISGALATDALGVRYRALDETLDAFDEWARRMTILPTPSRSSVYT